MFKIRPYKPADYDDVKKILKLGKLFWKISDTERAFRRKIKTDPNSILVATEDGRVVGIQFIVADFLSFLFRLAVHPKYRNKGIGHALMKKGEDMLKKRGFSHANVIVNSSEAKLQKWYRKRGYKRGHNYVWMYKKF